MRRIRFVRRPRDGDPRRTVVTPEGLSLDLVLAPRAARVAALVIDSGLIFGAILGTTLLLYWLASSLGLTGLGKSRGMVVFEGFAIVWLLTVFFFREGWFLYFELGPRGATPGKRLLGIRVAARDGGRLTTEAVIARNLMRDIELLVPLVLVAQAASDADPGNVAGWASVGWIALVVLLPVLNRDRLRAGDIVAGTWVVVAPRARLQQALSVVQAPPLDAPAPREQWRFTAAELEAYGEYELKVLERVVRERNRTTQAEVAATIAGKIGRRVFAGEEASFLEAYYGQLRARLERGMRFGTRKADKHDV